MCISLLHTVYAVTVRYLQAAGVVQLVCPQDVLGNLHPLNSVEGDAGFLGSSHSGALEACKGVACEAMP
jgi:hypothetical protein